MKNMYEKIGHIPVDSWWHAGLVIWSVWLFKGTKLQRDVRPKMPRSTALSCHSFGGAWQTRFSTLISCDENPKKWGMQRLLCVSTNWRDQIWQTNTENILCSNHFNDYIPTMHCTSIVMIKGRIDPSNRANIEQRKDDKSLGGHWSNMSSQ